MTIMKIQIEYENDRQIPGCGVMHCIGACFPEGDCTITVRREREANNPEYLNREGRWTSQSTMLPVRSRNEDNESLLLLKPIIVTELNDLENYVIQIMAPDGESFESESLTFNETPDVPYGVIKQLKEGKNDTTKINPENENPDIPVNGKSETKKPEGENLPPKEEADPTGENTGAPDSLSKDSEILKRRKRNRAFYGAAPVAFLIIILLVIWLKPNPKPNVGSPPVNAEEQSVVKEKLPIKERVTAFITSKGRSEQDAVRLYEELLKEIRTPNDEDEVFRLLYHAAYVKKWTTLLEPLAACFDPSRPKWGSVTKNLSRARELYRQAKQAKARP